MDDLNNQQSDSQPQEEPVNKEVQELQARVKELDQKAQEYLDGWKRAKADFINYKKEQEHTLQEFIKFANQNLILQILPILDNFNIAVKHLPVDFKEHDWIKGILHIKTQLEDIIKTQGLEEIKTVGERFNPEVHEVVAGEDEGDVVIEEIQKGYRMHGRVVRAAKVKVGK